MRYGFVGLFLKFRKCVGRELWTIRDMLLLVAKRESWRCWLDSAVLLRCLLGDNKLHCAVTLVLACHLNKVPGQLTKEDLENITVLQGAFLVGRLDVCSQGEQVLEVVFATGTCHSLGESMGGRFHVLLQSRPILETFSGS